MRSKARRLSLAPRTTGLMASSFARSDTACDCRPLMIAVSKPAMRRRCTPWPSKAWKAFSSSPSGPYQSLPSVSTPSTSKIMRRTRRARASASGARYCIELDDFGAEQVVHIERAEEGSPLIDDQKLVDLELLHQMHGLGGEHVRTNGLRIHAHDFVD